MRIELENNQLDLGTTPIENMFINTYLSQANEIQIKVYIYALSQVHSNNKNITNENIAREMGLTEGQVVDAWIYWIDQGLVEKKEDSYIFKSVIYKYINSIGQMELSKNNELKMDENDFKSLDNSPEAIASRELIDNIEQFISMGNSVKTKLNPREIKTIIEIMNEFNLSSEYLSYAYMMASNVRKLKSVDPVIATVRNWIIDGFTSQEKLDSYLSKNEKSKEEKKSNLTSKSDSLYKKDDRMTKEEREKFIENKLKKKLPIKKRDV